MEGSSTEPTTAMEGFGASIPGLEVERANEAAQRLRRKKREGFLDNAGNGQCNSGRRHKERTALGTLNGANGATGRSTTAAAAPTAVVLQASVDSETSMNVDDESATDSGDTASATPVENADADLAGAVVHLSSNDPLHVSEYADEIYNYLRSMEQKFMAKPRYMRKQRDINHNMRAILVDWLVEVAQEYKLDTQTLFIAVGYIDRFLSEMSVQRQKLQLVGVTAMLLAAKYEEIYPPAVDEFVYITDSTYTKEQILKMEHLILKILKFDMGGVTAYSFHQRFAMVARADDRTRHLTQFLIELTLQDGERYLQYPPSIIAAASLCTALYTLKKPCWTPTLEHYSGLSVADIKECTQEVYFSFANASYLQQQAVKEKFSHSKYLNVSQIPPPLTPPLQ